MDTLFWTTLNPDIVVQETTKQFYGRFLYRLVINCPAGRVLDSKIPITDALESRRFYAKSYNYGGSWWNNRYLIDNADPVQLTEMRAIKQEYGDRIRMRVEEPRIQIYTEDLSSLMDIVDRLSSKTFISVSLPRSEEIKDMLRNGVIIKKTPQEFKYKIICKDGRYSQESKQQILNYLLSLEDMVKVPFSAQRMLENTFDSCWGVYFYTKDLSIITFIKLIEPGLVSNIHEIAVLDQ